MFDSFDSGEPPDVPDTDWDTLAPPDDDHLPPDLDTFDPPPDFEPPDDLAAPSAAEAAPTLALSGFEPTAETDTADSEWEVIQAARFFGQERIEDGRPTYTVNALAITESSAGLSAMTLPVAAFDRLAEAQFFYAEAQAQIEHTSPIAYAQSIAAPGAEWHLVPLDDAYQIFQEMEALDQDSPSADLDLRPVMDVPEQISYEPCLSDPEDGQAGLFVGRFVMDGRHPDPLRADYRLIGTYDPATAEQIVEGLQRLRSEMRDIAGEDTALADQAMLSAARDIAVDSGQIAPDDHLFDNLPFDDRLPLDDLLQRLPTPPDFTRQAAQQLDRPTVQQTSFALEI